MNNGYLKEEDYAEPCCPFEKPDAVKTIPVRRVLDKLDEYFAKDDSAGAERHLNYWLAEAEENRDRRGELTVRNELVGLYRKTERETEALDAAERAIRLAKAIGLEGSVTMGTTLLNAATAYKVFDQPEQALALYEQARDLYEANLPPTDERLAGLYNNMAVTLTALERYAEARDLYEAALSVISGTEGGQADEAVTYLNFADLIAAERGPDAGDAAIRAYLDKAEALLNDPALPHDGYYAFVCEKCAPTFAFYGYYFTAKELEARAREIYGT
ncbi:MAG: tetratricopeptide repeat protein [Clostridia bacterium]|nr:tetratricopeptide repeat protein [Clostridia bacterium]